MEIGLVVTLVSLFCGWLAWVLCLKSSTWPERNYYTIEVQEASYSVPPGDPRPRPP